MAGKRKVLVVDQNKIVRDWVKAALQPGVEVLELDNATGVGASVLRDEPDLMLIDVELPVLDIERVVALAREAGSDSRALVVLFSTLSPERLEQKVAESGADGYLPKSGDAETFKTRVNDFLDRAGTVRQEQPTVAPAATAPRAANPEPAPASAPVAATTPAPAAAPVPVPAPKQAASSRPITFSAKNTVIIAGTDSWSKVVINWLSGRFTVATADSAEELRTGIQIRKPSLVVLGQDMPDATVEQICRAVRSDGKLKRTSLLYIGRPGDSARAKAVEAAGANIALLRPLDESTFFSTVNDLGHVAVRRNSRLLVRLEVRMSSGPEFHVGFTSNLSASGMLVESTFEAEIGAQMSVRFFIPGRAEEVAVHVEVIRVQGRSADQVTFGAHFVSLEGPDRAAIEAFVAGGN